MEVKLVATMAALRFFAGLLELGGATLMLRLGKVEYAFQVNAWLGVIGPTIFLLVSALGLAGMVGQVPPLKIAMLFGAVILILLSAAL
ncbi:MAG: DUF2619 domain-containing protein [bacterium]